MNFHKASPKVKLKVHFLRGFVDKRNPSLHISIIYLPIRYATKLSFFEHLEGGIELNLGRTSRLINNAAVGTSACPGRCIKYVVYVFMTSSTDKPKLESMNYGRVREVGHLERFPNINSVVASNAHRIIQRTASNLFPRRDITHHNPHFKVFLLLTNPSHSIDKKLLISPRETESDPFLCDDINHADFSMGIPNADF